MIPLTNFYEILRVYISELLSYNAKKNQAWIPKKNFTADGAKFASLAQKCPRTFFRF